MITEIFHVFIVSLKTTDVNRQTMYMMVTEIFHFFIVPLKTTDVNGQTSLPTILPEISSKTSTTSSTETDTPAYVNITKVTGMTYRRTYPFINLNDIQCDL